MKKCPSCSYERRDIDDIIDASQCPKCGIIYEKWGADAQRLAPVARESAPLSAGSGQPKPNDKKSVERLMITGVSLVAALVLLLTVVIPWLGDKIWTQPAEMVQKTIHETQPDVRPAQTTDANRKRIDWQETIPRPDKASQDTRLATEDRSREYSIVEIMRLTRESVVLVQTGSGVGSGFFINDQGHIVTNKHVLPKIGNATIKTATGRVYPIHAILAEDTTADLVIASTGAPPSISRPVRLSSRLPEVGEKILVIGNPMGLEQTVSDGIVSALRASPEGVHFIQVTAPVSPGNSGGPLLNLRGEVIGVATFQVRQGQNLNFCVAASRVASLHRGEAPSGEHATGNFTGPEQKPIYCFADSTGKVSFVEWRTGMQVTRPDGSLDSAAYQRWVIEEIGGNPDRINPEEEAREAVQRDREKLFKSVLPYRSVSDSLTPSENELVERRYHRHYVESYNKAMVRRNDAVRKYHYMMQQYEAFRASRD